MNHTSKTEADRGPGPEQRSGRDRRSGVDRRAGADRRHTPHHEPDGILARDLPHMPNKASLQQETMLINEISLVLAEKRTSLSVMRTGLAVLALPLSVLSVLIVISRYYDPAQVIYLLGPLLVLCAGLIVLGIYLISSSVRRIRALNRAITVLKIQNGNLRELSLFLNEKTGPAAAMDY